MKPSLIVIYCLIVILPLGLLIGLGISLTRRERAQVEDQFQKVFEARLTDVDDQIQGFVKKVERQTLKTTGAVSLDSNAIRKIARENRRIKQVFVLKPDGKLLLPNSNSDLTEAEKAFLERTRNLLENGGLFVRSASERTDVPVTSGWRTWFWDQGANFIYWYKKGDGRIIGVELKSIVLISDLIARLPDSGASTSKLINSTIALLDASRNTIYQWGNYDQPGNETPKARISLGKPFNMWTLEYYTSNREFYSAFGSSMTFNILAALVTLGIALVGLAYYYYRENSRQLREAAQKVSFVNQVSHELKTPLTNIRLYAELLEGNISEEEEKSRNYLEVIVNESQRLSRLIANVLTFAKRNKEELKLRLVSGIIDEAIEKILEKFRPSLLAKEVKIEFLANAKSKVLFDVDALEQIVGNLLNNIEKYAYSGKFASINSQQESERTIIEISDRGPGIPGKFRKKAFIPFERLSSKLTEGVSGTGIGLAIARDLAQKHGGDLVLKPGDMGATFIIYLNTPRREET